MVSRRLWRITAWAAPVMANCYCREDTAADDGRVSMVEISCALDMESSYFLVVSKFVLAKWAILRCG